MSDSNKSETNGTNGTTNAAESNGKGKKGKGKDKPVLTPGEQMAILLSVCITHAASAEKGRAFAKIKQGGAYQSFLDFWCGTMGNARSEGIKLCDAKILETVGRTPNSSTVLKVYHLLRLYAPTMLERIERDDASIPAFAYDGLKVLMIFTDRADAKAECNEWIRKTEQGGKDVPHEAVSELVVKFITREIPTVQSLQLRVNKLLGKETPERKADDGKKDQSAGELAKLPNGVPLTSAPEADKVVSEDKESVKISINGGTPATATEGAESKAPEGTQTTPETPTEGTTATEGAEDKATENAAPATPGSEQTASQATEGNGTGAEVAIPTVVPPALPLQTAAAKNEHDPLESRPANRAQDMIDKAKTSLDEGDALACYGKLLVKEGRERGKTATDFLLAIVRGSLSETNKAEREAFAKLVNGIFLACEVKERRNAAPATAEVGEG